VADEPLPEVGLCSVCVHARIVRTPRSRFWMCRLSATDPEFARYPRLPVLRCSGHQRGRPSEGSTEER
jgi:hypothetical protein